MKTNRKKRGIDSLIIVSAAGPKEAFKARADLIFKNKLDQAVTAIENDYLSSASLSIEDISNKVLKEAKRLTGSAFGFAGYIDPSTGWFIAVTHTREIWDKCRIQEKTIPFKEFKGLWGWVLKNKKPVLTNTAAADRRSCGTPKGHIKIDKFLAAPAIFNRKLAGMLALANPAGNYAERDLAAVNKLARTYAIILQRKFAEDRLRESEAAHRAIIDSSRDIIYTVNTGGIVTYMSRQAGRYGYAPGDIVGRHVLEFAHPEDRPMLARALDNALKTGRTLPMLSYRVKKKDGSYFDAEQKSGVIKKDGRPHLISCVIRDVSQRKQLEGRLAESESKYRTLFENANAAIFIADAETGKILDVNRRAESLTGRLKSELIGMDRLELHPREEAEHYKKHFKSHISRGGARLDEAVIVKKNGARLAVQINAAVMELGGRKIIQGIFEDITESTRAAEALRQSERKIRALFDQTFQFIGMMTPDGTLIEANRTAMQFAGINESDCLGRRFWETPWWTHSAELQDKLREAVAVAAKGETVRFEATHLAADGTLHYIDFSLKPVKDVAGKVIFLIPEGRDITDHRRIEMELRENEETLRKIFDNAKDAIFIKDLQGRFIKANRACAEIFGVTPEEMTGKIDSDLFFDKTPDAVLRQDEAVSRSGQAVFADNVRETPKGARTFNIIKTPLRNEKGEITGFLAIARDVTELRKMEAELAHAKAVEAVSSVAHDYNNILAAISGYASLILENLSDKSPAKPEIQQILKAVARASSVPEKYTAPATKPDNKN